MEPTAEEVQAITAIVREADQAFQKSGGTSRHWVADCFLPLLYQSGWRLGYVGSVSVVGCEASGIAGQEKDEKTDASQ
jgi:hypothetical protein